MKIDTKVTSFIMLVILIGLAIILPMRLASAGTNNPASLTDAEIASTKTPLGSRINVTYAYVDLNQPLGNGPFLGYGAKIHIMANITLTSEVNLDHADGKAEFYVFHLYSERGSIANITSSIEVFKSPEWVPGANITGPPINGSGGNVLYFRDGTTFDANKIIGNNLGGGGHGFNSYSYPNRTHIVVGTGPSIIGLEEKHAQVLADLRNAQTLYIDATRVLCITCQDTEELVVTPTLFSDGVLCHVELTKVNDRFGYGAYTGNEYYYPMTDIPSSDGYLPGDLLPEDLPDLFQSDTRYTYAPIILLLLLLVCLFLFFLTLSQLAIWLY